MISPSLPFQAPQARRAFSLVELMMVLAIVGIVLGLVVPAFQTIKSAGELTNATNGVAGTLEQARAYAMANNLYVYVGITEVNADMAADAVRQVAATPSLGGRLAVATVAVRNGTRGYDLLSSLPDPAWTNYNKGAELIPLGIEVFNNIHLVASPGIPVSGSMVRPKFGSASMLGNASGNSVTSFSWPLGTALGAGQYQFVKVIQFDPQGVARIQESKNQDNIVGGMEVGLQQTHGSNIPALPTDGTGAVAVIQIDAMTGATRIYRP